MYNPSGSDTGKEWIEIYNNDSEQYNITGWKLNTGGSDHALNVPPANGGRGTMIIAPSEYFVIVQDANYFVSNFTFNGTVIDSSWQDLSNSANETIWIKNSSIVFYNITISPMAAEGNSTCLINGSLTECVPTPGITNVFSQTNATTNTTNTTSCNLSAGINLSKTVFGVETVNYKIILNNSACSPTNATVYSSVEDLFGTVIRSFSFTQELSCSYTSERQWTPDEITGSEAYYITANITQHSCNDTYAGDNYASKIVVVKGPQAGPQVITKNDTTLKIDKVNIGSDNEISYGEAGEVRIEAYRGNTGMNSVDVYVQNSSGAKLSYTTNFNLNTKFGNYSINVPIQMKPNCDGAFPNDTFEVVVSGLGLMEKAAIKVNGISTDACKTVKIQEAKASGKKKDSREPGFEVVKYDQLAQAGDNITTTINISNEMEEQALYTIYSYVYGNGEPVSLGYDIEKGNWTGAYDANKKSLTMLGNTTILINLENVIESSTKTGEYRLRVRAKYNGLTMDATKKITIEGAKETEKGLSPSKERNAGDITNESSTKPSAPIHAATGRATDKYDTFDFLIAPFRFVLELAGIFPGRS